MKNVNIVRGLKKSFASEVASYFVKIQNQQEAEFRHARHVCATKAENMLGYWRRNRDTKKLFSNALGKMDIVEYNRDRPTLVYSTEVRLTPEQKRTLELIDSDWEVYSMVYNVDDRCAAVLIHRGTVMDGNKMVDTKWGLVYPDGEVKISHSLPVKRRGSWNAKRKIHLPKECDKKLLKAIHEIENFTKRGSSVFSVDC